MTSWLDTQFLLYLKYSHLQSQKRKKKEFTLQEKKRSSLENIHLCHPPPLSAVGDSACGSCFLLHPAHFTQTHLLIVKTSFENTTPIPLL